MKKYIAEYLLLAFVVIALGVVLVKTDASISGAVLREKLLAAVAYIESITPLDLRARHTENRLRVLIVPGHDNEFSGTEFRGIRESDLNLEVAQYLYAFLIEDGHFEVSLARDLTSGEYAPALKKYFTENQNNINNFIADNAVTFSNFVREGDFELTTGIYHGFAKSEVAYRLYGINKWGNENKIDVIIHLHFNDYGGRRYNQEGKYSGFAVYVPDSQYSNSRASIEFGEAVSQQLQKYFPLSDLPQENKTVAEDQELIAIGAKGSRKGASILVEYGYIYESQFSRSEVRSLILPELAFQTYKGIQNYFDSEIATDDTTIPTYVSGNLYRGVKGSREVVSLQKILIDNGYYPPEGKSLRDCPINGTFGPCVEAAVISFQQAEGIDPVGKVGPQTRGKLNAL